MYCISRKKFRKSKELDDAMISLLLNFHRGLSNFAFMCSSPDCSACLPFINMVYMENYRGVKLNEVTCRLNYRPMTSYYHLRSTVKRERFFAQFYFSNETVYQTTVSTGPIKMFHWSTKL